MPSKARRVATFAESINKEIDVIAHPRGLVNARRVLRKHVRIVHHEGSGEMLNELHPHPPPVLHRRDKTA